ncbi:hypothetical protein EDD18DRAFT_1116504 [Armillaria luteobubalina]|uniref:Uncharacterized protein n=1 Tax=Armillaria luteobubalina TaxID=153913 RepID=A0AA39NZ00_9AGAR|nr:hypothetical protein EDD18DRAFT_1116504 [Armillaria luteobubalina]
MFMGSSGTLTPSQEQIDLHLFWPLNSPVYPKFCLVHGQIALAVGFLSYQVKWTVNSHWAWTPNNLIPATLWRLDGPQPVMMPIMVVVLPTMPLFAVQGWFLVYGRKYELELWHTAPNAPHYTIHHWKHH